MSKARDSKKADKKTREDRAIAAAFDQLGSEEVRAKLASLPHPMFFDSNLLNYVEWMIKNAGRSGRLKAAKVIEDAAKGG